MSIGFGKINPDKILKASISNLESVSSKIESVEKCRIKNGHL